MHLSKNLYSTLSVIAYKVAPGWIDPGITRDWLEIIPDIRPGRISCFS